MEKSWENFWTTGKVEDYLAYRNRAAGCEEDSREMKSGVKNSQSDFETNRDESSWKGFT